MKNYPHVGYAVLIIKFAADEQTIYNIHFIFKKIDIKFVINGPKNPQIKY